MNADRITYLDAEAQLGGEFLHPGGRVATERLLDFLTPVGGDVLLELGCGTGTTTALLAARPGVSVIAIDRSRVMLETARNRVDRTRQSHQVRFIQHDLEDPLPLESETCDAAFAESVLALMDPEPVIREIARVLKVDGKLALNERVWRSGLSRERVSHTNALSRRIFGIPAATPEPLDRDGWVAVLQTAGFQIDEIVSINDLPLPEEQPSVHRSRLGRYRHYLRRPWLAWRQVQFKLGLRRHRHAFDSLESYLFLVHKADPLP